MLTGRLLFASDRTYVGRIERGVENPTVKHATGWPKHSKSRAAELLLVPESSEKPPPTLRRGRKKR